LSKKDKLAPTLELFMNSSNFPSLPLYTI
jgi:hypothetical protein